MPRKHEQVRPVAYSYLRFSTVEQAKGDSIRRQTELRDAWLARSGVQLDTSLSLRDEGRSAFSGTHRSNPDRNALAAFLELVRRKKIARGSYLIVENLDRLTREHIRPALTLLLNLIESGIRVVQLLPAEQVFDENVEPMNLMMAIMELSRGHNESRMKSERIGKAWQAKKRAAAANGTPITSGRLLPAWVRLVGGKFELDESAAASVRRVFRLAIGGHGVSAITKRMNEEGVPPIGRAKHWVRSYVHKLLTSRSVFGEFQPHAGQLGPDRRPDGPPIPNYFPPVVTQKEFMQAAGALGVRRAKETAGGKITNRFAGRIGKQVHLFTGLLRDARDGGSIVVSSKPPMQYLVPYKSFNGIGGRIVGFRLEVFEAAILSRLREVDPRAILPDDHSGERVLALNGERADVEARLAKITARMVAGDELDVLVRAARELEEQLDALRGQIEEAEREAVSPLGAAWNEYPNLHDAIRAAEDATDARTRLRAVLRRIVSEVRCLFVKRDGSRVAVAQVWFTGGEHRDYIIHHTPARVGRAEAWSCQSMKLPGVKGGFDLRDKAHAAELERVLATIDPKAVA